jgi:hypothetical protein
VTEVRRLVVSCGIIFQKYTEKGIVIQIFGLCTKQLFQKINIQQLARKQVKQLMSIAGIIHCDSA